MSYLKKTFHRAKKNLSSALFTTTLLLVAIVIFLFNLNFESFWVKAQSGQNIYGEGTLGYLPKWVTGILSVSSDSATVTVNAEPRRPIFIEN